MHGGGKARREHVWETRKWDLVAGTTSPHVRGGETRVATIRQCRHVCPRENKYLSLGRASGGLIWLGMPQPLGMPQVALLPVRSRNGVNPLYSPTCVATSLPHAHPYPREKKKRQSATAPALFQSKPFRDVALSQVCTIVQLKQLWILHKSSCWSAQNSSNKQSFPFCTLSIGKKKKNDNCLWAAQPHTFPKIKTHRSYHDGV